MNWYSLLFLAFALSGVIFVFINLIPNNSPKNLIGYFTRTLIIGIIIIVIGFGVVTVLDILF